MWVDRWDYWGGSLKKKIKIFIFIDSYGHELFKKYGMLHSKFKYCNPVKMQFGYSSTAIPTILTGRKPKDHGQLTFFFHDRNAGETMFSFFEVFAICLRYWASSLSRLLVVMTWLIVKKRKSRFIKYFIRFMANSNLRIF